MCERPQWTMQRSGASSQRGFVSRWLCYVCLLVGLLSLATGGLLAIVSLPTAPTVAQADGGAPNLAYVAGAGANGQNLAIIDIAQRHETGHITLGGSPVGVVLSVDSRFAFVTERAANRLAIVDTRAKQVAATLPLGRPVWRVYLRWPADWRRVPSQ